MKGLIIFDLIIVVAIIAMIGITSIIAVIMLDDFSTSVTKVDTHINVTYIQDAREAVVTTNAGSVFLFIGLVAGAVISSYGLRQHPMFAIFTVIVLYISAFIVAGISNFYQDFISSPSTVAVAQEFNLITALMQNIVSITFIVGTLIIIVMFAHGKGDSEL